MLSSNTTGGLFASSSLPTACCYLMSPCCQPPCVTLPCPHLQVVMCLTKAYCAAGDVSDRRPLCLCLTANHHAAGDVSDGSPLSAACAGLESGAWPACTSGPIRCPHAPPPQDSSPAYAACRLATPRPPLAKLGNCSSALNLPACVQSAQNGSPTGLCPPQPPLHAGAHG